MVCPRCNQPVENGALFCGNCGNQIVPVQARGATVADATELITPDNRQYSLADPQQFAASAPGYQQPARQRFDSLSPISQRETISSSPPPLVPPPSATPPPGRPGRSGRRRLAFIATIIALLVIGLSAGVFTLIQQKPANTGNKSAAPNTAAVSTAGSVAFSSSAGDQGITDTVSMDITGLSAPTQGMQYDAWIRNTQQEQTTPLGQLSPQGHDFVLTHTDKGHNLLSLGDTLLISQEKPGASLPTNSGVLSAQFPQVAFIHIKHLLVAFSTTPHNVGLLVGLLGQAQQVEAQALLLKNVSDNGNTTAVTCAAQNLLNLVEGQNGQHFAQLPLGCSTSNITVNGDGFGLLGQGYISLVAQHASLAAQAPDATDVVKTNAGHVETSMNNVKDWMTTIDQDAQSLLTNPGDKGKVQEIVTSANYAVNGFDLNSNGDVNSGSGQAGVVLAFKQAQLMAQLALQKV